eukprot:CAMPEP_0194287598 /NCGR_PEP_ID=MMETSP0169-20130528/35105_1 /TAXON_ID=218684 /ORGANISM="Corethron pennatum, Strain L29A3" /LENGTH=329 /DNA_ID=CAMNT_0039034347 /DNA_START=193 /DNA_END=1179 /DNA_ORIENTATION=+
MTSRNLSCSPPPPLSKSLLALVAVVCVFGSVMNIQNNGYIIERETQAAKTADSQRGTKYYGGENLNCLSEDGPFPIILMSLGRSGSGSTWQMISKLTGKEMKSDEYTGSSISDSLKFFENIGPTEGGKWMMDYLCSRQRQEKDGAGVVGFKWKPHLSIYLPASQNALELIARLAVNDPPIRVVRSRRNSLDVYLSGLKHASPIYTSAHCKAGDISCIRHNTKAGLNITIPDVKNLYKFLRREVDAEDSVDWMLKKLGVPTVFVSYEKLYFPKTPAEGLNEWKRIFTFLGNIGQSGNSDLTWDDIVNSMGHAPTSVDKHYVKIANFESVW